MLIEYVIIIGICGVSSFFNAIMTKLKCNKTIKKIKNKYENHGYIVDNKKLSKLFLYDLNDISTIESSEILNQKILETIVLFPLFNIVGNVHNIEYLMGKYENNKIFNDLDKNINTDFLIKKGIIKKNRLSSDITDDVFDSINRQVQININNFINDEIKNINKNQNCDFDNSFIINRNESIELLKQKRNLLETIIEYRECVDISNEGKIVTKILKQDSSQKEDKNENN